MRIMKALVPGSEFSYSELSAKADCPVDSLYVFCQRLEKAKLLIRKKSLAEGKGKKVRLTTTITSAGVKLVFPKLIIIA